jgi:hypothetical protein
MMPSPNKEPDRNVVDDGLDRKVVDLGDVVDINKIEETKQVAQAADAAQAAPVRGSVALLL